MIPICGRKVGVYGLKWKLKEKWILNQDLKIQLGLKLVDLNINIVPFHNPEINKGINKSKKRTKIVNHIPVYKMMKESEERSLKLLRTKKKTQIPRPGYYIDIKKKYFL